MGAAKVQKLFNDALKTLKTLPETFDSYPSNAEPPDPWVVEKASTPMAHAEVDDTTWWDPYGSMPGKSVKLDGEANQFVRIKAAFKADTLVLGRLALRVSGNNGSHAKTFTLLKASTGHTILQLDYHTDGHLWTYNGATPVDLGALAFNVWKSFAFWLDVTNKKFWLYVGPTRFPAVSGTYDFINTEVPDVVQAANTSSDDMWVDFIDDWSKLMEFDFDAETNGNPPGSPWTVVSTGGGSQYVRCDNSDINPNRWWLPAGVLSCKFHVNGAGDVVAINQSITPGDFIAVNFYAKTNNVYQNETPYFLLKDVVNNKECCGIWYANDGHVYTKDNAGTIDIGQPTAGWLEFTMFVDVANKRFYIVRDREIAPRRFPSTAGTYYTFQNQNTPDKIMWGITGSTVPQDFWLDDIWWTMDGWFEDFDAMTTGSPPTDPPWTTEVPEPPMVHVVDTPHQGATGKALRVWPGPDTSGGYARGIRPIRNFRQVFEVSTYVRFDTNTTSSSKRVVSLMDTYTGESQVSILDNSDAHVYFTNGAVTVQGPVFVIDTWYSLMWHVDLNKRTYHATWNGTRYPTTGTYALTGTQEPNALKVEAATTNNGLYIDTVLAAFDVLLRGLEVSPIYPRKPIQGKPFLTTDISNLNARWGWVGRDANGRRVMLREGEVRVSVWVPRAAATGNLLESESDTELLDNLIDAVASSLINQRFDIPGVTKLIQGSPTRPNIDRDGKLLYRALPIKFQHWEVM